MDDYKFGTEIIPKVFRLHETHGYEQCESFINKLLNDENADMTEIQQWELKQLLWGFTNNPHKEIECYVPRSHHTLSQIIYHKIDRKISYFPTLSS